MRILKRPKSQGFFILILMFAFGKMIYDDIGLFLQLSLVLLILYHSRQAFLYH